MRGTIKNITIDKGYGFIKGNDGNEYFFHRTNVARGIEWESLSKGENVEFDEAEPKPGKGPRAENVERA